MYRLRYIGPVDEHYHLYLGAENGPVRALTTRASDVFRTREAATKFAARSDRATGEGRSLVRLCRGGDGCPGADVPEVERPALPRSSPRRRRRPARLLRLRRALDRLGEAELEELESYLTTMSSRTT